MRLFTSGLCITVVVALLAGCFSSNLATPNASAPLEARANHLVDGRFIPGRSRFPSLIPLELQHTPAAVLDRITPGKHKKAVIGVYGSTFYRSTINGYKGTDRKNGPPICSLGASYPNAIAVDGKGDLIDPDGGTRKVIIYKTNCGPVLGVIADSYYGIPSNAASFDAVKQEIAVGNIFGAVDVGGISVCTLDGGCTMFLTNPNLYELAGVALAKNGDCWASGGPLLRHGDHDLLQALLGLG